jgi:lipopolysaccharide biosynthesis regulator YciM
MSDFKEMLFSETIVPKNWQELQAKDEAMQKEIDDQLEEDFDFKCVDCSEKYTDNMASEHDVAICKWCCEITQEEIEEEKRLHKNDSLYHEMKESGMDFSDFI